MTLRQLGPHQAEIWKENGGVAVFFSYNTPVAAKVAGKLYRTERSYSVTTSRHINKWLGGRVAELRPQEYFDGLV